MMKLVVMNGELAGQEFALDGPQLTVGRRADNDIAIVQDMKVSRRHARVFRHGADYLLEDVGSANGTFVEQRRIYTPTVLQPGDRFRVGRTWLQALEVPDLATDSQAAGRVVLVDSGPEGEGAAALGDPESVVFSLDAAGRVPPPADAAELQRRLAFMSDFGRALGSILELPRLLSVAAERIMDVIPAQQASLLLVDAETGDIVPRVVRSRTGELPEGELRISRHMVMKAVHERLAVLTTDATADARFLDVESVQELHIRSAICAPMVTPGGVVGAIYLDTRSGTHVFSEPDVHLVASIAAQVGTAVENARLYTDVRRAYDELQAAQEQLLSSERVAAIGMLAASIAHDMANIVSPMKPLVQLVAQGQDTDGRAQDVLLRQADRLVAMVERLQAFSRRREVRLASTALNTAVENTHELLRTELVHRKVQLTLDLAQPSPLVMADGAQLERALLNLVVNAADALEHCETREVRIKTEVEEDEAVISVQDTGPGIPEELQQRLFEPFFTTKATGTGLGLYSCRRIIEDEHHGSLEVDSRVGAGTTITIRLPLLKGVPGEESP